MSSTQSADGTRIHFEVEGSGPPVLLQHGFMASGDVWRSSGYVNALRGGYSLILIDGRGHGQSDKPHGQASYVMHRRVEDVIAVIDAVGAPCVHLHGYSMGGHIAFGVAKYAPDRLLSLAIGGMHPYPRDAGPMTARAESLRAGMEATVVLMEQQGGYPIPEPYRSQLLANDAEALIASTLATRDERGLDEGLAEIAVPTLIYCGTEDPGYELAKRCASEIATAKFVTLDGQDHVGAHEAALPEYQSFLQAVS